MQLWREKQLVVPRSLGCRGEGHYEGEGGRSFSSVLDPLNAPYLLTSGGRSGRVRGKGRGKVADCLEKEGGLGGKRRGGEH